MRACREGAALPPVPSRDPPAHVPEAASYAGHYGGPAGRSMDFAADGGRLFLLHKGARVPLQPSLEPKDAFTVLHPDYAHFEILFSRAAGTDKGAVLEASWGEDWVVAAGHKGPAEFNIPEDWRRYVGHYRNEDPWIGSNRIVLRKGKLWLNGVIPLEPAAEGRFYLRDEPGSPEWVDFSDFVGGRALHMRLSGADLWRT